MRAWIWAGLGLVGLLAVSPAAAQSNNVYWQCKVPSQDNPAGGWCPVSAANPLPTLSSGGGGGAVTIADGADVALGTTTDLAWSGSGSGTVVATTKFIGMNTLSAANALGSTGDTACATDNGTCTLEALIKRSNQRLSTINTTLGTPFQTGGTVIATQGTAAAVTAGWPTIAGEPTDTTGTFTNGTQTGNVATPTVDGYETATITIHGTYATATATFLGSDDGGTTYYPLQCARSDGTAVEVGYTSLTNVSRAWYCPIHSFDTVQVLSSAVASGTVSVRISISSFSTAAGVAETIPGVATAVNQPTNVAQGSTTAGETGLLNYCATLSAAPTYTTAQSNPCNIGVKGDLLTTFDGINSTNLTGSPFTILDRGGSARVLAVGGFGYNGTTQDVLRTAQGAAQANSGVGVLAVEESGRTFSHISTSTTTTVKSGAGFLHTICINSLGTVASTTTIYDNTAGSGTVIAVVNSLTISGTLTYDVAFSTGLTLVTTGTVAPDITVSYR